MDERRFLLSLKLRLWTYSDTRSILSMLLSMKSRKETLKWNRESFWSFISRIEIHKLSHKTPAAVVLLVWKLILWWEGERIKWRPQYLSWELKNNDDDRNEIDVRLVFVHTDGGSFAKENGAEDQQRSLCTSIMLINDDKRSNHFQLGRICLDFRRYSV